MTWTLGGRLTDAHRDRLLVAGVERDVLDGLALREVTGSLPGWWADAGNGLYLADGVTLPEALIRTMTLYPFRDALVVIASDVEHLASLLLGGDGACIFLGPRVWLTAGEIYCGAGSRVVLNGKVVATRRPVLDARNGGSIVCAPDQLWAADVYIATDDMHRLEDLATGTRINSFGADIRLGRHVWLGRDVVLTGHVEIGDGAVVGLRSLVRGDKVAANTAVAGTPARVIREGITWAGDDTP